MAELLPLQAETGITLPFPGLANKKDAKRKAKDRQSLHFVAFAGTTSPEGFSSQGRGKTE